MSSLTLSDRLQILTRVMNDFARALDVGGPREIPPGHDCEPMYHDPGKGADVGFSFSCSVCGGIWVKEPYKWRKV